MATKRRGSGEGTIHERADGRWEARLVYYDGATRRKKSFYARTRREAAAKLAAATVERQAGLPVLDERETVANYVRDWLETVARPRLRDSTYRTYRGYVNKHIIPALGRHRLAKLEPQHVQTFLNQLAKDGKAPRTVQQIRAIVRAALAQALRWNKIGRNVAALTDPPRVQQIEIVPLTPDQVRALLEGAHDDPLINLYAVAVGLGLRQGELLGLRWSDVDLPTGTLTVRQTRSRASQGFAFGATKTDRSRRTLALPRFVVSALVRQRERQREAHTLAGESWVETGLVFTSTIGTPLDGTNVTHRFQRTLTRLGLPRQRFHDLRHATASLLLSRGLTLKDVQDLLGHSQIALTANLYGHIYQERRREIANQMDAIFEGTPDPMVVSVVVN